MAKNVKEGEIKLHQKTFKRKSGNYEIFKQE